MFHSLLLRFSINNKKQKDISETSPHQNSSKIALVCLEWLVM